MTTAGWLPAGIEDLFGPDATAEEAYDVLTVDVPPAAWIPALETARDRLGCTYFDWLSAVDEPGTGFRVAAHVVALSPVRRLLLRTTVPHAAPVLPSAVGVYAGARWHERETHEMFGVTFEGHPGLDHLLLPENFEGHPLRKDFVLAARVAKAWPGAKEPGESEHGGPKRRQMLPPGVPDPNDWGPLRGQLPPAPARPARGAARTAGDRPARRARTSGEGSASQAATPTAGAEAPVAGAARRARTATEGSASQAATPPSAAESQASEARRAARSAGEGSAAPREGGAAPRRARSASEGSASRQPTADAPPPAEPTPTGPTDTDSTTEPEAPAPKPAPRSPDAPWHHARPAFEEPEGEPTAKPEAPNDRTPDAKPGPDAKPAPEVGPGPDAKPAPEPAKEPTPEANPEPDAKPEPEAKPEPDAPPQRNARPRPDTPPDPNDTAEDPAGGPQ